jgi:hypothetical protein
MIITNIKSRNDLENKKKLQAEQLQLRIDNESSLENRIKNYQGQTKGIISKEIPPIYKSATEIQKDALIQQKDAISNLKSIGFDDIVSSQTVIDLQRDNGLESLIKLNKNFPYIKEQITKRFNPKYLDVNTLITYLKEFFDDIDTGLQINLSGNTSQNYFSNEFKYATIIPSKEIYDKLKAEVISVFELFELYTNELNEFNKLIDILTNASPNDRELESINLMPVLEKTKFNKLANVLISKFNIPSTDFINSIFDMIYKIYNDGGITIASVEQEKQERNNDIRIPYLPEITKILNLLKKNIALKHKSLEELKKFTSLLHTENTKLEQDYNGLKINEKFSEEPTLNKNKINLNKLNYIKNPFEDSEFEPQILEKKHLEEPTFKIKPKEILTQKQKEARDLREQMKELNIKGHEETKQNMYNLEHLLGIANEDKKLNYIKSKIKKLNLEELEYRLSRPNFQYGLFLQVPTIDMEEPKKDNSNVIFEYKGNTEKPPFLLNGKNIDVSNDYLDKFLLKASTDGKYKHRYEKNQLMQFLEDNEYPDIKNKIEEIEDFDPKNNLKDRVIESQGFGLPKYAKRRIKIGSGVKQNDNKIETYRQFGKYVLLNKMLNNNNVFNLRNKSLSSIPNISPCNVDDNYKEFINDFLDSGKINKKHFESLTKAEKEHFNKVVKLSNISINTSLGNEEELSKMEKRFNILYGEICAGNDNEKVITEARQLLKNLISNGIIEKTKGMDILIQLA